MTCERWRSMLTDAALGIPPTPELLRHLEGCAGCGARLAELRGTVARIDAEIQAGLEVAAGAPFLARVRQRAAERKRRRRWLTGWLLPVAAVAGVLALSLLVPRGAAPPSRAPSVRALAPEPPPARADVPDEPPALPVPAVPARDAHSVRRAQPSEPEAFLRPGEKARIRALAESLQSRPVSAASLLAVGFDPGEARDAPLRALPPPARDVAGGLEKPLGPIQIAPMQAARNEIKPLTIEPGGQIAGR
jgi:hypothetical protein